MAVRQNDQHIDLGVTDQNSSKFQGRYIASNTLNKYDFAAIATVRSYVYVRTYLAIRIHIAS